MIGRSGKTRAGLCGVKTMRTHSPTRHSQSAFKPARLHDLASHTTITIYAGPDAWAEAGKFAKLKLDPVLMAATGNEDPLKGIGDDTEQHPLVVTSNELEDPIRLNRKKLASKNTRYVYIEDKGNVPPEQIRELLSTLCQQAPNAEVYHNGSSLREIKDVMAQAGLLESVVGASEDAMAISNQIKAGLLKALGVANGDRVGDMLNPDLNVIERMITSSFWSGQKSKLFILNRDETLNQFSNLEAYKFLVKAFGSVVDESVVDELISQVMTEAKRAEVRRFRSEVSAIIRDPIIDHIKDICQRDTITWTVDMFANEGTVQLIEDQAKVTLSHKPLRADTLIKQYDPDVIADYKQHFTRFDELLEFLVMARFAKDRKKAYLWIHADSDWGKGFLKSMLNKLGLAVELSVKEIERIFEGGPVSKSPADFRRAFALVVDEFKSVKSEIKQLEGTIRISPKNQLQSEIEVFAKLFLSAEHVSSLAGENGVEDQFANRMSIFRESGSIDSRELFRQVGSVQYLDHITLYAAEYINEKALAMRSKGPLGAATIAEQYLNSFIKRNGLDTIYQRFSDSLPELAATIADWAQSTSALSLVDVVRHGDGVYLKSGSKAIGTYINENFERSDGGSLHPKKDIIARLMSEDGAGIKSHKVNGKVFKAIKLK